MNGTLPLWELLASQGKVEEALAEAESWSAVLRLQLGSQTFQVSSWRDAGHAVLESVHLSAAIMAQSGFAPAGARDSLLQLPAPAAVPRARPEKVRPVARKAARPVKAKAPQGARRCAAATRAASEAKGPPREERVRRAPVRTGRWTPEEDKLLYDAIADFGMNAWTKVGERVGTRNRLQCFQRYSKVLDPRLAKGRWTDEEDARLRDAVQAANAQGDDKSVPWESISRHVETRSAKQCRERWINFISPDVKRSSFSAQEEKELRHWHARLGNQWSEIAKKLPGRSSEMVKGCIMKMKRNRTKAAAR